MIDVENVLSEPEMCGRGGDDVGSCDDDHD